MNATFATAEMQHALPRRAALAVHALAEADREWLLSQLPAGPRAQLLPLLEELRALGIPPQRQWLDEATAHRPQRVVAATPQPAPMPAKPATPEEWLAAADAAAVAGALRDEPAGLVAEVLQMQAWPWRAAVLDQLAPGKRRRVQQLQDQMVGRAHPPQALQRALVAALHQQLVSAPTRERAGVEDKRWIARIATIPSRKAAAGVTRLLQTWKGRAA